MSSPSGAPRTRPASARRRPPALARGQHGHDLLREVGSVSRPEVHKLVLVEIGADTRESGATAGTPSAMYSNGLFGTSSSMYPSRSMVTTTPARDRAMCPATSVNGTRPVNSTCSDLLVGLPLQLGGYSPSPPTSARTGISGRTNESPNQCLDAVPLGQRAVRHDDRNGLHWHRVPRLRATATPRPARSERRGRSFRSGLRGSRPAARLTPTTQSAKRAPPSARRS